MSLNEALVGSSSDIFVWFDCYDEEVEDVSFPSTWHFDSKASMSIYKGTRTENSEQKCLFGMERYISKQFIQKISMCGFS